MPKNWNELEERVSRPRTSKLRPPMPTEIQINNIINKLCIQQCGKIPTHISECKGCTIEYSSAGVHSIYTCKIRLLSDNINFALEMRWRDLTTHYYKELKEVIIDAENTTNNT